MGARGVVTSAHPLASMAGIQMLQAGGNAVDAAVAVGSTLNVVEPFMSSAGGIGLMLISRGRTGERHVLDFIGRAPRASDPAACTDDELAGGPKSCATPGNLGGWLAALDRFGSMDRARVLAPAISLAEDGVPLTFKNVEFIDKARATLARSQEAQRLYLGNGGPRVGGIATYKELASMLRQVAEGGAEAFYRGPIARAIARAVREAGGWLTEADLAGFAPEWREPVAITYRGWQVLSVPPPFSAFQMLETLNILEGYDLERHPRLVRDLADHAADAPQRAGVRHEHPRGDRGAARACVSRSIGRRGVAHSGRDARGPRRTRPRRQPYRRLVVDRRRWTGNRARPGIRGPDGGRRSTPRRVRPGDLGPVRPARNPPTGLFLTGTAHRLPQLTCDK